MQTLNKVELIGRMGDNIKLYYSAKDVCIGRFRLATNEFFPSGEGYVKHTDWHNIVVQNKIAEYLEKHTKKGDLIYISGRIKYKQWQDKEGNFQNMTEILVFEFKILNTNLTDIE